MFLRSSGEAIKIFGIAAGDPNHDFHKYAEDYTLFELGEWDEMSGTLVPYDTARPLIKAIEASRVHADFYFAARPKLASA